MGSFHPTVGESGRGKKNAEILYLPFGGASHS